MKITISLLLSLLFVDTARAFAASSSTNLNVASSFEQISVAPSSPSSLLLLSATTTGDETQEMSLELSSSSSRREALHGMMALASGLTVIGTSPSDALAEETPILQKYEDFEPTSEGWSFREVKVGDGASPNKGDRVVFDWSGYTIGYFGRPFEAKGGPQGGAFDKELDYSRTEIGSGKMVKGLECALSSMKPGGIRQVLIPFGELGYPQEKDPSHEQVGPKPTTFSGQRALNFVLDNPRVDRTLLFNVKLIRVDKPDGKGGYIRGEKRT
ncbi:unnamed protein product [Cylindrotheca closterium]|uniref:peptidylprolyl isomerase n=1 Tax=Cylindrotheca closterium TaxID=2856 RepID=A0AAD2JJL3_9STRA|nr:unnamed protein product [Cylindrotheca closterium]